MILTARTLVVALIALMVSVEATSIVLVVTFIIGFAIVGALVTPLLRRHFRRFPR